MLKLSYHTKTSQKGAVSLMSNSITQDMTYRQSLMKYAEKYGVSRASRKYNKSRSYIYFWKQRWDGSAASLACQSRWPHSHPNQHTETELKLIRDIRRRNPTLDMIELWHRLRQHSYTRCPESLFRVMRKMDPSRRARSGGCEGRAPQVHRKSGAAVVPVHRHRRVHTAAFARSLPQDGSG